MASCDRHELSHLASHLIDAASPSHDQHRAGGAGPSTFRTAGAGAARGSSAYWAKDWALFASGQQAGQGVGGSTAHGSLGALEATVAADEDLSPAWSPEFETAQALSSSPSGSFYSSTTTSSKYSLPSSDEVASVVSTPPSSYDGSSHASTTNLGGCPSKSVLFGGAAPTSLATDADANNGRSKPHPCTFDPPLTAAWDFDRLFGRRRRWFGGVRVPNEEGWFDGEGTSEADHSDSEQEADGEEESERHGRPARRAHHQAQHPPTAGAMLLGRADAQSRQRSAERPGYPRTRSISRSRLSQECLLVASEAVASAPLEAMDATEQQPHVLEGLIEVPTEQQEEAEELLRARQKAVFEALRATASRRLGLVCGHLNPGTPVTEAS